MVAQVTLNHKVTGSSPVAPANFERDIMMKLKCMCCQFEQEFAGAEEAFDAGWDAPPHFTGIVCCDLCPASFVVMGCTHEHAAAPGAEIGALRGGA